MNCSIPSIFTILHDLFAALFQYQRNIIDDLLVLWHSLTTMFSQASILTQSIKYMLFITYINTILNMLYGVGVDKL